MNGAHPALGNADEGQLRIQEFYLWGSSGSFYLGGLLWACWTTLCFQEGCHHFLRLKMSLPHSSAGEGWRAVSWDCAYYALGLHRPGLPPHLLHVSLIAFRFIFFFQQNRPKRRQARNPEMFLFSAPVRPNDESTCGVCGTCWRNAPGVLELGDLHLVRAHL